MVKILITCIAVIGTVFGCNIQDYFARREHRAKKYREQRPIVYTKSFIVVPRRTPDGVICFRNAYVGNDGSVITASEYTSKKMRGEV